MDSPISSRCAVLQSLRVHGRMTGAALVAHVGNASNRRVRLHDTHIYRLLRELQEEGLVVECAERTQPPSQGGKPGRLVTLTPLGQQVADEDAKALRAILGIGRVPRPPRQPTMPVAAEG